MGEAPADIERAWRGEVRQHLADIGAGRAKFASWDDARKRIFAHVRGPGLSYYAARSFPQEHDESVLERDPAWGFVIVAFGDVFFVKAGTLRTANDAAELLRA